MHSSWALLVASASASESGSESDNGHGTGIHSSWAELAADADPCEVEDVDMAIVGDNRVESPADVPSIDAQG